MPLDAVYSSDLQRASATAEILARGRRLEVRISTALREVAFGQLEGLTRAEGEKRFPEFWNQYLADSVETRFPGGESFRQVEERVLPLLEAMRQEFADGSVAVVSHGGPLRAIACHLLGLEPRWRGRLRWDNTAVAHLRLQGGRVEVLALNDVMHLRCKEYGAGPDEEEGSRWRGRS